MASKKNEKERPLLEVKNVFVALQGNDIIKDISFGVCRGSTLAVIGPNGAGKSVLLRAIIGLVSYSGTITLEPSSRIGYVPQRIHLDQHLRLTVEDLFSIKKRLRRLSDAQVKEAIERIPLPPDTLRKQLINLSAGNLQRVMIIFAIMDDPQLLLFDEPTANIDIPGERTIYESLHQLQDEKRMAVMLVSHDLYTVSRYASHVLCLNKEMVCFGDTHEFLEPSVLKKLFGDTVLYHHKHEAPYG
ncbi:MAG: metal ABC transporter ATP-binding protein [bacterium]|nr:metal ABC transporter ATP-binding protein [bacterium]